MLQLLSEHGFDGMAEAIEILMNEAMKLQRADALGAMPYQRSESRRGYANGFKPKTVNSRLGRLNLKVPQTRDVEFYPSALERGERSERALKLPGAILPFEDHLRTRSEDPAKPQPDPFRGGKGPAAGDPYEPLRDKQRASWAARTTCGCGAWKSGVNNSNISTPTGFNER